MPGGFLIMKKLLLGLFCGLFVTFSVIGAAVNWDKDFVANFMYEFMALYARETGTDIKDVSPEIAMKMQKFTYEFSKEHGNRMYSGVAPVMQSLCKRMQKYVKDSEMDIVIPNDLKKEFAEIAGVNFANIKCDTVNALLIPVNMIVAKMISDEQDVRAQKILDAKTDNQRILEYIAQNWCGLKNYDRPMIECSDKSNTCVVNQNVNGVLYSECCLISYSAGDFIVEKEAVYDAASINIRTNGYVRRPHVRSVSKFYPSDKEMSLDDFDRECKPMIKNVPMIQKDTSGIGMMKRE